MSVTVSYMTNRRDPRIEWFWDAIHRQAHEHNQPLPKLIVVDFYKEERDITKGIWRRVAEEAKHVPPKPCVWQGKHRLTKENWFAAANARNTALCLCDTDYIGYIDDLSWPTTQWLVNLNQSCRFPAVTLGAYRKVKNLMVENGECVHFEDHPGGHDNRWTWGADSGAVNCDGNMLYGCSLVGPTESFLSVGGWPEFCDGLGFEDVIMGTVMQNRGIQFKYNRNMLTYESEELHGAEPAFRKESFEAHPNDASDKGHAALNYARGGTWFPNVEPGIRKIRDKVLAWEPFPVPTGPTHDWHVGKALAEL